MAIRTITGHLTATNKRHISAMFDVNRLEAKVNRITYRITEESGIYTVRISRNESDDWGRMRESTSTATFEIIWKDKTMAKKAMFTATSKAGTPLNVYGETCENDQGVAQVRVWTKYANYGFYNLDRFENGVLTAKTLRKLMTGKDWTMTKCIETKNGEHRGIGGFGYCTELGL
jgi:hypothetical protein